jgi:membrane protease YdiL (CAAX protease family)
MSQPKYSIFTRLTRQQISVMLLAGLLFLRLPYLAGIATWIDPPPAWLYFSFIIGTYLLTAILIYIERDRLQAFWFDVISAIIFLFQSYLFLGGIALFAAMGRKKAKFPAQPAGVLRWMLFGGLLGVLSALMLALLKLNPSGVRSAQPATLWYVFSALLVQMTNAAVWEEPLFRGFLWGHLRLAGWKNAWIWLFQAGLFTLGHIYYLRAEPFGAWLVRILVPALVIGLAAWGARSITASMVTHGFFNATGDLLMHLGTPAQSMQVAWTFVAILSTAVLLVIAWETFRRRRLSPNQLIKN